jgi:hypothetical protein
MSKKQVSPGIRELAARYAAINREAAAGSDAVYRPGSDGITVVVIGRAWAADRLERAADRLQRMIEWLDDEADSTADDMVPELGQKLLPFLLPRKLGRVT